MRQFISKTDNTPYMNVMFGNFYCPAFDDESFVDETMALIRELGFNSVMFDTKAWEDFKERYETGALSQYVKMQEYMGDSAHRHGLCYNFLLLYLNGDNLYPRIRFSPPIFGEEITYLDGRAGRYYKYWSPKAKRSMKEHVDRIMERYGQGCERCGLKMPEILSKEAFAAAMQRDGALSAAARRTDEVIPVCSMWDPVVAPSFDAEGQQRYLSFLRNLYHGDIEGLNSNYGILARDFEDLMPADYWFGVKYAGEFCYTQEDVCRRSPRFYVWRDNALWKIHELTLYFKTIGPMLKENNPALFLCPDMTQWGYFLNIYGRCQQDIDNEFSDLWDTALRGIDIYALAPYVDSCHFVTVPVTPDGYPDAYVVSCQHSMMRVMNEGKPVIGGIYWGRYIYNDIYAQLSPAEILGSMVACGIDGYHCYGMNGLDDGGVMNRMDEPFLESLKQANAWCKQVILKRQGPRKKEIALLFPSEMAHLEPFEVENNKIRRLDLLGWYKYCCDLGYQVDVISGHQILSGALPEYKALIVADNDCYFAAEHDELEEKIRRFVCDGGVLIHGPLDELAKNCFGIRGEACDKQPYRYVKAVSAGGAEAVSGCGAKAASGRGERVIIPQGEAFCRYEDGEEIASYVDGGGCCAARYDGGRLEALAGLAPGSCKGAVYAFGVQIGAAYAAKNIPHVPYAQGNKEMYPLTLSKTAMISDILSAYVAPAGKIRERGIETGVFANGMVIVNHRSTPYTLPEKFPVELYQYKEHAATKDGRGILGGHEAVWVSTE